MVQYHTRHADDAGRATAHAAELANLHWAGDRLIVRHEGTFQEARGSHHASARAIEQRVARPLGNLI